MGGGQSHDGIDGEEPYWVHISKLEAIKGQWLPHQDFTFDGYIVTEWVDEKTGKVLRNSRGTSGFSRHGNYRPISHADGVVFNEFMDFNVMFTQLCRLRFKLCERKDGVNGIWDHSFPLAVSEPTDQTLMDMVKGDLLGKEQTVEFHHAKPEHAHVAMRLTFTVGDRDHPKPTSFSEGNRDMGNGPVELVTDKNGDGQITMADTSAGGGGSAGEDGGLKRTRTEKPKLLTADSVNLSRKTFEPASENPADDV